MLRPCRCAVLPHIRQVLLSLFLAALRALLQPVPRQQISEVPPRQLGCFSLLWIPMWDWESFALCSSVNFLPFRFFADTATPRKSPSRWASLPSGVTLALARFAFSLCCSVLRSGLAAVETEILWCLVIRITSALMCLRRTVEIVVGAHPYSEAKLRAVTLANDSHRSTISFSGRQIFAGIPALYHNSIKLRSWANDQLCKVAL
jgi:hypothetical protein